MEYIIANFYHFFEVQDKDYLLYKFLYICKRKNIKGSITIANEGVNAAIAGSKNSIKALLEFFRSYLKGKNFILHCSQSINIPFEKLKIKIKAEIISLKMNNIGGCSKHYIDPKDWNEFIQNDDVLLVDVRNNYESDRGYFKGAIKPNLSSFREFPKWFALNKNNILFTKKSKLATYCTGGIRCEKFVAYLKYIGYDKEVFQLKGGILGYLGKLPKFSTNSWSGSCFVFDNRILLEQNSS